MFLNPPKNPRTGKISHTPEFPDCERTLLPCLTPSQRSFHGTSKSSLTDTRAALSTLDSSSCTLLRPHYPMTRRGGGIRKEYKDPKFLFGVVSNGPTFRRYSFIMQWYPHVTNFHGVRCPATGQLWADALASLQAKKFRAWDQGLVNDLVCIQGPHCGRGPKERHPCCGPR